jgi:hypothetical protein
MRDTAGMGPEPAGPVKGAGHRPAAEEACNVVPDFLSLGGGSGESSYLPALRGQVQGLRRAGKLRTIPLTGAAGRTLPEKPAGSRKN